MQAGTPDIAAALKIGLRGLAKAVTVISCCHGSNRYAMTATAVNELSMDPPSMLICVNKSASLFAPLAAGAHFCINVLQANQANISALCSGKAKGEARFAVGSWCSSALGPPYLQEAQASFICRNVSKHEFGTHGIFVGQVEEVRTCEQNDPLVYMDGRYGAFASTVPPGVPGRP
ncbi:MAG TPA: flavin reductase family protein [Steroidobacteraceae bacterium]|nr:flavin reductase family protein [Steroidobacteraceae bacterium]